MFTSSNDYLVSVRQCFSVLNLMFRLMDRVDGGVIPMLHDLSNHIREAGLADMHAFAATITTVRSHPLIIGLVFLYLFERVKRRLICSRLCERKMC